MIMIFGTLCKMIFLKVLIFFGFYWGKRAKGGPKGGGGGEVKRAKNSPNDKKLCCTLYLRNHT